MPSVSVHLPSGLARVADLSGPVSVPAMNVTDALATLVDRAPGLRAHLFDDAGRLRNYINVFVNDRHVRDVRRTACRLGPGDSITIVASIAGG